MKLQDQNATDKVFVRRVGVMIESGLIGPNHYIPWADEVIGKLEKPPLWMLKLAAIRYPPHAVEAINAFVDADPIEGFDRSRYEEEYLACLFLRYRRRELSWAGFLDEAGRFTDAWSWDHDCEEFYYLLNVLEENEYAEEVELSQCAEVEEEFRDAVAMMGVLYEGFLGCCRKYVTEKGREEEA